MKNPISYNLIAAPPTGTDFKFKPSREDPLKHTQKMSSKSVNPCRRSSVTYTRIKELYILYKLIYRHNLVRSHHY